MADILDLDDVRELRNEIHEKYRKLAERPRGNARTASKSGANRSVTGSLQGLDAERRLRLPVTIASVSTWENFFLSERRANAGSPVPGTPHSESRDDAGWSG